MLATVEAFRHLHVDESLERFAPFIGSYVNELAAFGASPPAGPADGYPFLNTYWRHPTRLALAFGESSIQGFALLFEDQDPCNGETTMDIREFFVCPRYRRSGVGSAAAAELLRSWQGPWQLAVLDRNTSALKFWQSVLSDRSSAISVARGHYQFSIARKSSIDRRFSSDSAQAR